MGMSLKDAYRERMAAQIEEQRAQLLLLKAKAKRAVADGKIMAYEELPQLEAKLEAAASKLKELSKASEGAVKEVRKGVEKAVTDLVKASKKAAGKFKCPRRTQEPSENGAHQDDERHNPQKSL